MFTSITDNHESGINSINNGCYTEINPIQVSNRSSKKTGWFIEIGFTIPITNVLIFASAIRNIKLNHTEFEGKSFI